ncbi:MAG: hypothetical protein JSV19_10250, partial [Phycisphaerales bacterium]
RCMPGGGFCLGTGNSVTNHMPVDNYLAMLDEGPLSLPKAPYLLISQHLRALLFQPRPATIPALNRAGKGKDGRVPWTRDLPPRIVCEPMGNVTSIPQGGGLHHRYARVA